MSGQGRTLLLARRPVLGPPGAIERRPSRPPLVVLVLRVRLRLRSFAWLDRKRGGAPNVASPGRRRLRAATGRAGSCSASTPELARVSAAAPVQPRRSRRVAARPPGPLGAASPAAAPSRGRTASDGTSGSPRRSPCRAGCAWRRAQRRWQGCAQGRGLGRSVHLSCSAPATPFGAPPEKHVII